MPVKPRQEDIYKKTYNHVQKRPKRPKPPSNPRHNTDLGHKCVLELCRILNASSNEHGEAYADAQLLVAFPMNDSTRFDVVVGLAKNYVDENSLCMLPVQVKGCGHLTRQGNYTWNQGTSGFKVYAGGLLACVGLADGALQALCAAPVSKSMGNLGSLSYTPGLAPRHLSLFMDSDAAGNEVPDEEVRVPCPPITPLLRPSQDSPCPSTSV